MSRAVPSLFTQPIELLFPTLDIGFSPETFIFFTNEIFSCKQRDFYSCWYFIVARCFLSSTPGKKLIFAEIVSVPNFPFSSTPLLLNVTRKVPPNHFTSSNTPEIQMLTSMFNDFFSKSFFTSSHLIWNENANSFISDELLTKNTSIYSIFEKTYDITYHLYHT